MYLVRKIVEKCEKHSARDWLDGASGSRTMPIQQEDYDRCGKQELIQEVRELTDMGLLTKVDWAVYGSDVSAVRFKLEKLPQFYEILRAEAAERGEVFLSKQEQVNACRNRIESELAAGIKKAWIRRYYEELLDKLARMSEKSGSKIPPDFEKMELYLPTFRGLDELEEPVFKRVFSKRYLGNSKKFEKDVQNHVISTAKLYYDEEVEPDMNDTDVLEQLLIQEYAQEMALKGPLKLRIGGKGSVDLSVFAYGTVLNSETLKYAEIEEDQPQIRRIMTIENKANFVAAPFREDTLYVFCHGYFSPREREFLRKLRQVLEKPVEYFHSGDLDYGGVKIFEYIQKHIFPELKPWMMDVETYLCYEAYAEPLEGETLEKLKKTQVEPLQGLIRKLCETGKGIEQECFLMA